MKLVDPLEVTDAEFNDSAASVPENDNTIWDAGTPYGVGNTVMMTTGVHKNYECLIANTGQDPSTNPVDGGGLPYWLDLGATNRWAMFDEIIENQTSYAGDIVFELTPGEIVNSFGLLNIEAETANITGTSVTAGGEFFNETINLISTEEIIDAYTYCFSPFSYISDVVFEGVPPYGDAVFTITLTTTTTAKLGEFVYGTDFDLGTELVGASPGLESFSTFNQNAFGQLTITPRGFRKLLNIDAAVPTSQINPIARKMQFMLDKPALWVGNPDNSSLIVYGILKFYNPEFGPKGSKSFINYEIQGFK